MARHSKAWAGKSGSTGKPEGDHKTIHYRSAVVPVKEDGLVKRHGKEMEKVTTLRNAGKRPKGSVDYRSPDKVY